ncbi:hypothetical protein QN345_13360 [Cryobacterium sp. 10I1]|uniref:hypothetical protein n=1 Tax=unclassified Cryobacterium TaxID=2649013 RepID=UPI002AC983AB|nr:MULTISPECIES: hypothetical protein [unclassified Cryobacterium]MEB0202165.1 hypothetical protein [Cryobacterium sp. 5I3]MEB0286358.1 hypothetical protein [Cryobacterium sp. 10S3]MEB0306292.1 hypothetical protein [Cryobacterium sp. 10I1]WPX12067.1 hypothetical protein RHM57_10175 [Cryobacterium sp. 10S3]
MLADDNFASIQSAVHEGRRIRDNLQKSIVFILPTTAAESLVLLLAVLFGFALPLQPTQILWVNLITAATVGVFFLEQGIGSTTAEAQTTAATTPTFSRLAFLFTSRCLRASSLTLCTPFMNLWFSSTPIGVREWAYTLGLSAVIFLLVEVDKVIGRARAGRASRIAVP